MKITYVGQKPKTKDNIAGTGLEWAPGQVHDVLPDVAAKLLKHPGVWAAVIPDVEAPQSGLASADDSELSSLREQCTARGIEFHHRAGVAKLRELLAKE